MSVQKIVIDTDILLDHVLHGPGPSKLRMVMSAFFCYTTVFNAVEAFAAARSEKEIRAVDDAMNAMKVLGFSAKSSKAVGKIVAGASRNRKDGVSLLIAGVCIESRLPIVTMNPMRYSGIKHLQVIPAGKLLHLGDGRER